jgi:thiol:disulfide interchange protein
MRSVLAFILIQLAIYIFSMSSAFTISLIVLGSALTLFAGAYISAVVKDKRHNRKSVNAALELN